MAFKNKEERNTYERARRANNPEAARKAREAARRSDAKHRNKRIASQKLSRELDPERHKAYTFKAELKRYGTTVAWYRNKLIEQKGTCILCEHLNHSCGTIQRLSVDHDHNCCDTHATSCGECLRGLLCETCNLRLSYLEQTVKDFPEPRQENCEVDFRNMIQEGSWTKQALRYLKKYQTAVRL